MRDSVVSDEEILDVFRNAADPVLTTAEITEQVEIERRGLTTRLNSLAEQGLIRKKRVGQGAVWWHPESLERKYSNKD